MAEIDRVGIILSLTEIRAVHYALGCMRGKAYGNEGLASAGSSVYAELTPIVDEDT